MIYPPQITNLLSYKAPGFTAAHSHYPSPVSGLDRQAILCLFKIFSVYNILCSFKTCSVYNILCQAVPSRLNLNVFLFSPSNLIQLCSVVIHSVYYHWPYPFSHFFVISNSAPIIFLYLHPRVPLNQYILNCGP